MFHTSISFTLLLILVTACQRVEMDPQPPDYLAVTGRAEIEASESGPALWPERLGVATLKEASEPIDSSIEPAATRILLARVEARRLAIQALMATLLEAPIDEDTNLGQWLSGQPSGAAEFDQWLDREVAIVYQPDAGSASVVATLPTRRLQEWYFESAGSQEMSAETEKELNWQAYDLAVQDLQTRMYKELETTVLDDGRSLKEVMEADATVHREIEALIQNLTIDETNYPKPGICEVKVFFDRNRVRQIVREVQRPWWQRIGR